MWSETFEREEREARRPGPLDVPVRLVLLLLALAALGAEVVMSVQITSQEFTARNGSVLQGLVAMFLGFAGPYATMVAWRSTGEPGRPVPGQLPRTALTALVVGAMAIAWLILVGSLPHPTRVFP